MNLLVDPLVGVRLRSGVTALSLPEVFAALVADDVLDFPRLRAHQRHPWHALLVQLGALARVRGGLADLSSDAEAWRRGLRALTPDFADDAPWHLVSPPDAPGFLQPMAGPLANLKNVVPTPDELDMLVTSRNHDIKRQRMQHAAADDWLFALVALQTSEGFLGAGNYGISRMNGGFANRPGLSLAPRGGIGAHVMRDIRRLVDARETVLEAHPHYVPEGLALLWLAPWDGTQALNPNTLDPYYIEICRRVRLFTSDGRIGARAGGSKVARVGTVKAAGGLTGDPWTPIDTRQAEPKALTIDARGFDYRRLSEILFSSNYIPALLQEPARDETGTGWTLVARALARGQGKTEGYHERRIPIPAHLAGRMSSAEARAHLGLLAKGRIDDAGAVRGALRFALMTLFQNGPDAFQPQDPASARHADPFLDRFQAEIDRDFFEALFAEAMLADDADAAEAQRRAWLFELLRRAERLLRAAEAGSPHSAVRHYRASVRAAEALTRGFFGNKLLKGGLAKMTQSPEDTNDEIGALANAIRELHHRGDRGALAELRRMDTAGPPVSGALHQLLARRYAGRLDEARARRLALFIRILALAGAADGLKDGPRLLGRRMEEVGVSPARVERLLAARGEAFDDQVLLLARRLANAGPLPFREIGQLILGDADRVERTRYDIARGYWTSVSAASPQTLSGDEE